MWKKKITIAVILILLVVMLYEVVFRTRTVTYTGEDKNWYITIHAKLVGLNGSYTIKVRYKGKEPIQNEDFSFYPHYDIGFLQKTDKGYYYWECPDDCGYYDKDSKIIFFVSWEEGRDNTEKMKLIELRKSS